MSKRAVMAFSGGLDSTGLLIHLLADDYRVDAISFDYGQKHSLELKRAAANVAYLKENKSTTDCVAPADRRTQSSVLSLLSPSFKFGFSMETGIFLLTFLL